MASRNDGEGITLVGARGILSVLQTMTPSQLAIIGITLVSIVAVIWAPEVLEAVLEACSITIPI